MNEISHRRPHAGTTIRFTQANPAATARPPVTANPHRFTDAMETAMTGLVFTGALLFAAGLLHILVPAGTAAALGEGALRTLACLTGAATLAAMFRGFFKK